MPNNNNNIKKLLEERESRYGDFKTHATITQELKTTIHNAPQWNNLSYSMQESLEMVMHKIGRILNGDPKYLDSWVDIIGYTQLVIDEINEKEQQ